MILYNIGIWLMKALAGIAARFNPKIKLRVDGCRGVLKRLSEALEGNVAPIVWIHASSLGEFEQGRPVVEAIRGNYPQYKILLTFFSPSGYEVRKNYAGADYIFYMPWDTPRAARRFVKMVNPAITLFVKYEFWLNFLNELQRKGCRTYIISAIFRSDSQFFKWYGGRFRRCLKGFDRLFVQDDESKMLLATIGVHNVVVSGDTRFDRVADIAASVGKVEIVEHFVGDKKVLIAGSTWTPDDRLLLDVIAAYPELKFILVPHEVTESHIETIVEQMPVSCVKYTDCLNNGADASLAQVMIVDTVGMLSSLYQYGSYAYIGGGFGVGIHNILEAATFGLPIAFGPNYQRFKEARDMVKIGAAHSVSSSVELNDWLSEFIRDTEFYHTTRTLSADYVKKNVGALNTILGTVFKE